MQITLKFAIKTAVKAKTHAFPKAPPQQETHLTAALKAIHPKPSEP